MRLNPKLLLACWLFAALCQPVLAKLNVVATTPDLASIAKAIGGDLIDLTVLAKPTEDPHFVDAKPSLILKLNRADVVIEGGAELEIGWLPRLLDQSRNVKLAAGAPGHVACAQGVPLKEIPSWLTAGQPRPSAGRYTFVTWNFYRKDSPLLESGLLGPVQVMKMTAD